MLARIARFSFHRRRRVLAGWFFVLVLAVTVGSQFAGNWGSDGRLPGTDSQRAADVVQREFPHRDGDDGTIVFADVTHDRPLIATYLHAVAALDGVQTVEPLERSRNGPVGIAPITLASSNSAVEQRAVDRMQVMAEPLRSKGVDVEFAGSGFQTGTMPASEIIGIVAAIAVLLLAFGSIVAMGLPIITALVGIGIAVTGVGLIAHGLSTPEFAPQVAVMIGLGVGIDYSLFIVTRYRRELDDGRPPLDALVVAMTTAGRAVVFAGCTVVISLLGMLMMRLSFVDGLAVSTSLAVAIAVGAAITLLPALLGFLGPNVNRLRLRRRAPDADSGAFAHWARTVQRRPALVACAALGILVIMALPVLHMRLGVADEGNNPTTSTTHKAYVLAAHGFGAGSNGPITVVLQGNGLDRESHPVLDNVVSSLRATPGVAEVGTPTISASGNAAIAILVPDEGPQNVSTVALLHHMRDDVVPAAISGSATKVYLGGETAAGIDFSSLIGSRIPGFIGAVLILSFLLLLLVFRSIVVPLKAVAMNLLSIGAAYGAIVAIFQWGWFGSTIGVSPAPIEAWVPMMMFAIVFGLSMDYEVFLLSSIREHYDQTGNNRTAVASGLASTARLITAAALIMVCVFASFVLSDARTLKLIGLGLAFAVAIDATIVRIVLVPATMELLGRANWWFPRWLDRFLPRLEIERHDTAPPAAEDPLVSEPTVSV
jgi:putative drug exporter of the RND superfamily